MVNHDSRDTKCWPIHSRGWFLLKEAGLVLLEWLGSFHGGWVQKVSDAYPQWCRSWAKLRPKSWARFRSRAPPQRPLKWTLFCPWIHGFSGYGAKICQNGMSVGSQKMIFVPKLWPRVHKSVISLPRGIAAYHSATMQQIHGSTSHCTQMIVLYWSCNPAYHIKTHSAEEHKPFIPYKKRQKTCRIWTSLHQFFRHCLHFPLVARPENSNNQQRLHCIRTYANSFCLLREVASICCANEQIRRFIRKMASDFFTEARDSTKHKKSRTEAARPCPQHAASRGVPTPEPHKMSFRGLDGLPLPMDLLVVLNYCSIPWCGIHIRFWICVNFRIDFLIH